jgi:hypothetical protein
MKNLFIIYFHKINIFNVVIYSLDFVFNTLERAFRDEKTVERYERKKKKLQRWINKTLLFLPILIII